MGVLEDFSGPGQGNMAGGSLEQFQLMIKDKKMLEQRVRQLEQTNNNWAQFHRQNDDGASTNSKGDVQRKTMTNFGKRLILEQRLKENGEEDKTQYSKSNPT